MTARCEFGAGLPTANTDTLFRQLPSINISNRLISATAFHDINASVTIDASGEATDDADARQRLARRQAQAAQTRMRRILHRVSVLVWLARGMSMDAAASLQAIQARILSVVGDSIPGACAATLQAPETIKLVQRAAQWMCHNFELCDADDQEDSRSAHDSLWAEVLVMEGDRAAAVTIEPTTQRAAVRLLMCIEARQGTEEQLGALFVALLRAKGFIARYTISLPVRFELFSVRQYCQHLAQPLSSPFSSF